METITIPEFALVLLVGASGSGKTTFAAKHFRATEILSSDACRALVADDENDLRATAAAFDVLHFIAEKRLGAGRLTVIDATNVQPESRRSLLALAGRYRCPAVAVVLQVPLGTLQQRSRARTDRTIPPRAINRHAAELRQSRSSLPHEGFAAIYTLTSSEEIERVRIERVRR